MKPTNESNRTSLRMPPSAPRPRPFRITPDHGSECALLRVTIFSIMATNGFPEADVALFQRMYTGSFLVMSNLFGITAACFLARGTPQGAPPSSTVYCLIYDPILKMIRACFRITPDHGSECALLRVTRQHSGPARADPSHSSRGAMPSTRRAVLQTGGSRSEPFAPAWPTFRHTRGCVRPERPLLSLSRAGGAAHRNPRFAYF